MSRFNTPVRLGIHSYRHRLVDADGVSAKAVIDALVTADIFPTDKAEQITEITYQQTKIKKPEEEKTVITIRGTNAKL